MKAEMTESTRVHVAIYKPIIDVISKVVAEYFNLSIDQVREHTRKGSSIKARQYIHYECRLFAKNCPLTVVGLLTGNGKAWDHASISHSYRKVFRDLHFKNPQGELYCPEVYGEVMTITNLVKREVAKLRLPSTLQVCQHCHQPLVILEDDINKQP